MLDGASILVTGGTGSFGKKFIEMLFERHRPSRVIVFSRDELKQFEMSQEPRFKRPGIGFFIGDVRDRDRLYMAFRDVDVVIHAAALKQVPACEYNPFEAVRTNVMGAQNIIEVAIERGVKRILALSTDKACSPINFYGATKLCSDKLFISGNHYAGKLDTRFAVVRYGNVVGSRGSVIPFFAKLRHTGKLPITHEEMTRFWITLPQAVDFVIDCLGRMHGGELYVPKIPSMKIVDLARVIGPDCKLEVVGIRPGEKLHEAMIIEDDGRNTLEFDDHFVVQPQFHWWSDDYGDEKGGKPVPDGFRYSSDRNDHWLTGSELLEMIQPFLSG
jgi:UDP-N-acetylglucosamine 4,6-dehydratase